MSSLYASDRPSLDGNGKCIGSHGVLIASGSERIVWRGETRPLNPDDPKDYSCVGLAVKDAQKELDHRKQKGVL